jgi:LPXTG-motif cell wall-anchored protein
MHDVTKRGLALAVATGGLLISGAAPAVSAVHHPEHPDGAGSNSQQHDGSSEAAPRAPIEVSGSKVKQTAEQTAKQTVKQYEGRHKASQGRQPAAASRQQAMAPATDGCTPCGSTHAPQDVCGMAVNAHGGDDGYAGGSCANGPDAGGGTTSSVTAARDSGMPNDNVAQAPVPAPGNVCGDASTGVAGHDSVHETRCGNEGPASSSTARARAEDMPGFVDANTVQAPVDAPSTACGGTDDVVEYRDAAVSGGCRDGSPPPPEASAPTARSLADAATGDTTGPADNAVVQMPTPAPVDVCGAMVNLMSMAGVDNPDLPVPPADHAPPGPPPHLPTPDGPTPRHAKLPPPVPPPAAPRPSGAVAGQLPHTGADVLGLAGIGAGALLLGAGAVVAARRRSASSASSASSGSSGSSGTSGSQH